MPKTGFRKPLSVPGLLRMVREGFDRLPDPITPRGLGLTDGLRSALAMFRQQSPSRRGFEPDARDADPIRSHPSNGYGGIRAPSESARRERLVDPRSVRRAFQPVVAAGQRGQGWGAPSPPGGMAAGAGAGPAGGRVAPARGRASGRPAAAGASASETAGGERRAGLEWSVHPGVGGTGSALCAGEGSRETLGKGSAGSTSPPRPAPWRGPGAAARAAFGASTGGRGMTRTSMGRGTARRAGRFTRPGPFSWVTDRAVTASHADPLRRAGSAAGGLRTNPSIP